MDFFHYFIILDETTITHSKSRNNQNNGHKSSPPPKKPTMVLSAGKIRATSFEFFIIFIDYFENGNAMNGDYYFTSVTKLQKNGKEENAIAMAKIHEWCIIHLIRRPVIITYFQFKSIKKWLGRFSFNFEIIAAINNYFEKLDSSTCRE